MNFLIVIPLLAFLAKCNAGCYDKYTGGTYSVGQKYSRSKLVGELLGRYSCTCLSRGRMYCNAVDIPCMDVTTRKYVPKGKRFNTILNGRLAYNCMCQGGRGSYDSCYPGHLQEGDGSCFDHEGEVVRNRQRYVSRRFGAAVRCLCENGKEAIGSCERVCVDDETGAYVLEGNLYTRVTHGMKFVCQCAAAGRSSRCRVIRAGAEACRSGQANCDRLRATCIPRGISYTCRCKSGYEGDGRYCSDVNECSQGRMCGENAQCRNTDGSHTCTCNEGYYGDGYQCNKTCRDEVLGSNAKQGQIYSKVKNGLRFNCACGKNGEEKEDSCTKADEETDEEQSGESPGLKCTRYVTSYAPGQSYHMEKNGRGYLCTCKVHFGSAYTACKHVYDVNDYSSDF